MSTAPKPIPPPSLPAGHPALSPQLVIANARGKLEHLEGAITIGDEEARLALLAMLYEIIALEAEAALEAIIDAGMTKKAAVAVLQDRRERMRLEEKHGRNWRSDCSNVNRQIRGDVG